jgi:DNA-binding NtrC family response regulator
MSPGLQMKLLRVLQEREFERLGDSHTIKVDVRVIASTHTDLGRLVADGRFREDLYYRLNVIPLPLPPLRQRTEDIPLLVQHFLRKLAQASTAAKDAVPLVMSQEAMRHLMTYRWPGNVRQLENALERVAAFNAGQTQIDVSDLAAELIEPKEPVLSASISLPEGGVNLDAFVARIERDLIHKSLERTGGNKGQAARLLGLKRTTLVEKLKRLDRS